MGKGSVLIGTGYFNISSQVPPSPLVYAGYIVMLIKNSIHFLYTRQQTKTVYPLGQLLAIVNRHPDTSFIGIVGV